jgi:hypothetical protein
MRFLLGFASIITFWISASSGEPQSALFIHKNDGASLIHGLYQATMNPTSSAIKWSVVAGTAHAVKPTRPSAGRLENGVGYFYKSD